MKIDIGEAALLGIIDMQVFCGGVLIDRCVMVDTENRIAEFRDGFSCDGPIYKQIVGPMTVVYKGKTVAATPEHAGKNPTDDEQPD